MSSTTAFTNEEKPEEAIAWLRSTFYQAESGSVSKAEVYAAYVLFCSSRDVAPYGRAIFGRMVVGKVFPGLQTRRKGKRGDVRYHYVQLQFINLSDRPPKALWYLDTKEEETEEKKKEKPGQRKRKRETSKKMCQDTRKSKDKPRKKKPCKKEEDKERPKEEEDASFLQQQQQPAYSTPQPEFGFLLSQQQHLYVEEPSPFFYDVSSWFFSSSSLLDLPQQLQHAQQQQHAQQHQLQHSSSDWFFEDTHPPILPVEKRNNHDLDYLPSCEIGIASLEDSLLALKEQKSHQAQESPSFVNSDSTQSTWTSLTLETF